LIFDFACNFYNPIPELWKVGEICVNLGLFILIELRDLEFHNMKDWHLLNNALRIIKER
jgi:hypothetical protein